MFGSSYDLPPSTPPDLADFILKKRPYFKWLFIGFAAIILLFTLKPFTIIPAGNVGVVTTFGSVDPGYLTEGFHLINPISSVHKLDVRLDKAELKNSNASTNDLQTVHTDIVVNYRIDGRQAPHIYKEFGYDLEPKVLIPAIAESFKATTAKYDAQELITKRDIVSASIRENLSERVAKYGLIVNDISLVNFGFSKEFENSIEAKVIATQKKEQAVQDLERIKVEAEQKIAQAKGEAESIRIQAQAIQNQGGAAYTSLRAIEKWDGQLPNYMGSGPIPFLDIKK